VEEVEEVKDLFKTLRLILTSNLNNNEKIDELNKIEQQTRQKYKNLLLESVSNNTVKNVINKISLDIIDRLNTKILKNFELSLNNNKDIEDMLNFVLNIADTINVKLDYPYAQFYFYLKSHRIAVLYVVYNSHKEDNYITYFALGNIDNTILTIKDLNNINKEKLYTSIINYISDIKRDI
jgi:hypothetical protein